MNCKNCQRPLKDEETYCHYCGARVIHNRLTTRGLISQLGEEFFNYDNRLLRTFVDLFTKPEVVIDGYIQGVRKRYANPVGYFTLMVTFSGLYLWVMQKFYPDVMQRLFAGLNESEAQVEASMEFNSFFFEYQSFIFFASIPLLALISKLVFFNIKRYNYTEHLVINIYAYSQASALSTLLSLATIWAFEVYQYVAFLVLPLQIVYYGYMFKRLYGMSLGRILIKSLVFLLILMLLYLVFIVIALVVMIANGTFMEMVEEQRARQGVSQVISSAMNWTS
jgi:hypothetical protein